MRDFSPADDLICSKHRPNRPNGTTNFQYDRTEYRLSGQSFAILVCYSDLWRSTWQEARLRLNLGVHPLTNESKALKSLRLDIA